MYTCPMHPEIKSEHPGRCPKCGMKLVEVGLEKVQTQTVQEKNSYTPLIVIFLLLLTITLMLALKDAWVQQFVLSKTLSYFMIGFFLVFSGFKLIDLKGFAEGYSTYDLLAQKWFGFGYVYPFIELAFGLGMIIYPFSKGLLFAEILVMGFSGVGVLIKLLKHEKFQCACLGTFLKVPLTKVTLIEDFGMAALALLMLLQF